MGLDRKDIKTGQQYLDYLAEYLDDCPAPFKKALIDDEITYLRRHEEQCNSGSQLDMQFNWLMFKIKALLCNEMSLNRNHDEMKALTIQTLVPIDIERKDTECLMSESLMYHQAAYQFAASFLHDYQNAHEKDSLQQLIDCLNNVIQDMFKIFKYKELQETLAPKIFPSTSNAWENFVRHLFTSHALKQMEFTILIERAAKIKDSPAYHKEVTAIKHVLHLASKKGFDKLHPTTLDATARLAKNHLEEAYFYGDTPVCINDIKGIMATFIDEQRVHKDNSSVKINHNDEKSFTFRGKDYAANTSGFLLKEVGEWYYDGQIHAKRDDIYLYQGIDDALEANLNVNYSESLRSVIDYFCTHDHPPRITAVDYLTQFLEKIERQKTRIIENNINLFNTTSEDTPDAKITSKPNLVSAMLPLVADYQKILDIKRPRTETKQTHPQQSSTDDNIKKAGLSPLDTHKLTHKTPHQLRTEGVRSLKRYLDGKLLDLHQRKKTIISLIKGIAKTKNVFNEEKMILSTFKGDAISDRAVTQKYLMCIQDAIRTLEKKIKSSDAYDGDLNYKALDNESIIDEYLPALRQKEKLLQKLDTFFKTESTFTLTIQNNVTILLHDIERHQPSAREKGVLRTLWDIILNVFLVKPLCSHFGLFKTNRIIYRNDERFLMRSQDALTKPISIAKEHVNSALTSLRSLTFFDEKADPSSVDISMDELSSHDALTSLTPDATC